MKELRLEHVRHVLGTLYTKKVVQLVRVVDILNAVDMKFKMQMPLIDEDTMIFGLTTEDLWNEENDDIWRGHAFSYFIVYLKTYSETIDINTRDPEIRKLALQALPIFLDKAWEVRTGIVPLNHYFGFTIDIEEK